MFSSAHDLPTGQAAGRRKSSAVVELGSSGSSRDVVELDDLSGEDQTLAQFGYKPVQT